MNQETHKNQLLEAIKSQDIELFWELHNNLRSQFGTDYIEDLTVQVMNDLTIDPAALGWFIDKSQATPSLNPNGELTGFTLIGTL
jgi:hypothetical protein